VPCLSGDVWYASHALHASLLAQVLQACYLKGVAAAADAAAAASCAALQSWAITSFIALMVCFNLLPALLELLAFLFVARYHVLSF
jgi:hypothetical protein